MRIKRIQVNNFKSLVDFEIQFAKFNCIIGLNGAGKSTLLQFLDFLGQQVRGKIEEWLTERQWEPEDIKSKLSKKQNIDFVVELVGSDGDGGVSWEASFNPRMLRCTYEKIVTPGNILEVKDGRLKILNINLDDGTQTQLRNDEIQFNYQGSILSQLKDTLFPQDLEHDFGQLPMSLAGFKSYFTRLKSLELLSPELLRQTTRDPGDSMGLGGQRLAAYLHDMKSEQREQIKKRLNDAYPELMELVTRSLQFGWKKIEIAEAYRGEEAGLPAKLTTGARHINDGMLRIIAVLAELQSHYLFLIFDEIENGINPELVEFLIHVLTTAQQQIVVTTHSPMILNYLEDEVAKRGVIYIYKTKEGFTKSIPFFAIPSMAKKLEAMGPGEVFVDTHLTNLQMEIQANPKGN